MSKENNNSSGKVIRTLVMSTIYVAMFALIVFTNLFEKLFQNAPQMRYGLGAVFLIYGLFRVYRLWRTY